MTINLCTFPENYHGSNTGFLVAVLVSVVSGVFLTFALVALCYRSSVVHKNITLCLRLVQKLFSTSNHNQHYSSINRPSDFITLDGTSLNSLLSIRTKYETPFKLHLFVDQICMPVVIIHVLQIIVSENFGLKVSLMTLGRLVCSAEN